MIVFRVLLVIGRYCGRQVDGVSLATTSIANMQKDSILLEDFSCAQQKGF
jgi:hypothetical protein